MSLAKKLDQHKSILNTRKAQKLALMQKHFSQKEKQEIEWPQNESNFSTKLPNVPNNLDRYLNLPDFALRMETPRKLTVRELTILNVSQKYLHEARQMIFNPLTLSLTPNLDQI